MGLGHTHVALTGSWEHAKTTSAELKHWRLAHETNWRADYSTPNSDNSSNATEQAILDIIDYHGWTI